MRVPSLLPDDEIDVDIWGWGREGGDEFGKEHTQDLHHHSPREPRTRHPTTIHSHTRALPIVSLKHNPQLTTHNSHPTTRNSQLTPHTSRAQIKAQQIFQNRPKPSPQNMLGLHLSPRISLRSALCLYNINICAYHAPPYARLYMLLKF